MPATLLEQASKMAAMANKISKIAKMGSLATKGILINNDIVKWADEGAKIHSIMSKGAYSSLANNIRISNLVMSAPVFVVDAIKLKPFEELVPLPDYSKIWLQHSPSHIISTDQLGTIRNHVVHLESISSMYQDELRQKQKAQEELLKWFETKEYEVPSGDYVFQGTGAISVSTKFISRANVDALNRVVGLSLAEDAFNERKRVIDFELITKLVALLEIVDEIQEGQKVLDLVRGLIKGLCSIFKQFQINRRESFRRINSFLFKNLDDYHSLSLISLRY
ncbi:MAG: hypothetical protein EOO50_13320 [Flavobacterium sp.]|uniref:hypothetical protein n=1 Tax=Flavobacterium sp. TaxID=239 RepID=UPI00120C8477|nr:hypothetical protein [Flavobacterium sp.]RZJ65624.1 MAG: hypothetical protein EOO50_13320 [Flavobacterium sp.]